MALPPIVALEIGTAKVVALVGELREDGHVMVTGMGETSSAGVRKGEVVDLTHATACVRTVLEQAEESSGVTIRQVHLSVSGGHIQSLVHRGFAPVLDHEKGVTQDDIDQVMEVARAVNLPHDREVLHSMCQHFCLDEQERVIRPEGMQGAKLSLDMLILHASRHHLGNSLNAVRSIPVDVQDVVFGGLSSALGVLTPEQKKGGVAVVDIGAGTTDYLVYAGNVVAAAGSFGVGGDHVTNDISVAFAIPNGQAETLKRENASAAPSATGAAQRVSVPADVGFQGRSVSVGALNRVVQARMDELLDLVHRQLEKAHVMHHLQAGVVLTGGGASLRGVVELAERVFGARCTVAKPRGVSGLAKATEGPQYAAPCGLIQYGFKTMMEERRNSPVGGRLRKLLGG